MKLILCVDKKGGLAFNKRRQSRDRLMIENLAELIGDGVIYMEPYSEELFTEVSLNVICSSLPLESAEHGDFVFVERFSPAPYTDKTEEIIVYNWNRSYPSDIKMGFEPAEAGFKLAESMEFVGNSHEKITREIYKR